MDGMWVVFAYDDGRLPVQLYEILYQHKRMDIGILTYYFLKTLKHSLCLLSGINDPDDLIDVCVFVVEPRHTVVDLFGLL